jgi:hypothetical protein
VIIVTLLGALLVLIVVSTVSSITPGKPPRRNS